jgi:hypothetical protein
MVAGRAEKSAAVVVRSPVVKTEVRWADQLVVKMVVTKEHPEVGPKGERMAGTKEEK